MAKILQIKQEIYRQASNKAARANRPKTELDLQNIAAAKVKREQQNTARLQLVARGQIKKAELA